MSYRLRVQKTRVNLCATRDKRTAWRVLRKGVCWRGEPPRDCKRAPLRCRDAAVTHLRRQYSRLVRFQGQGKAHHLG